MSEQDSATFDLENVEIVHTAWSGNNIIVRVQDVQDGHVLEDSFNDEITISQFSKEDVIDDKSTSAESSETNVGSSRQNQSNVIDDHGTTKDVPQRIIDPTSEMDIHEFVELAKNSNTKTAEKMVSFNIR